MLEFEDSTLPRIDLTPVRGIPCVCVSFSGGADSLVLLFTLLHIQRQKADTSEAFSLQVIHFEHGIRGKESLDDADFCCDVCTKLELPVQIVPLHVPESRRNGEGIEEAARRCRQQWWENHCREVVHTNFVVALGHHADDRIETAFLRLMRGSNSTGLTGMRTLHSIHGVRYWRPMLHITRTEIENIACALPFRYRTDSTNLSADYTRNKLRNVFLPEFYRQFTAAKNGILASLDAISCDADALDKQADMLFSRAVSTSGNSIAFEQLRSAHPAIQYRLLQRLFRNLSNGACAPDKIFMERFADFLSKDVKNPGRTLSSSVGNWCVLDGFFRLTPRTNSNPQSDLSWNYRMSPVIVFGESVLRCKTEQFASSVSTETEAQARFDAASFPETLLLTIRHVGDHIHIFGTGAEISIKKLFTDAHVSSYTQKNYPIMRNPEDNSILWMPRIRRSKFFPVTQQTKETVLFSIEKLIDVTAAVIMRTDGTVLVTSRPAGKDQAFGWEFPGGKIEPDESPEHCVMREIREELNMSITIHRRLYCMEHDYGKKYVRLTFFSAISDDKPSPMEKQEFKWLSPSEFHSVPMLPADAPFADYLKTLDIAKLATEIYADLHERKNSKSGDLLQQL